MQKTGRRSLVGEGEAAAVSCLYCDHQAGSINTLRSGTDPSFPRSFFKPRDLVSLDLLVYSHASSTQATKMHSREILFIIELIYWIPALVVSLYVLHRQGLGRHLGWQALTVLALFRLIGAATGIASVSSPTEGLIECSITCASMCLITFVAALTGIVLRVNMSMIEHGIGECIVVQPPSLQTAICYKI